MVSTTSPASDQKSQADEEKGGEDIYTVFSLRQRYLIVILLGTAMLASPLTATMYLPLLPLLATKFHTSMQAINLTITVYVIFQAISPVLLSSPSDHFGRRPIYLLTFSLYAIASMGLALNRGSNYALLIFLRACQSLGASAVLSMSYGSMADITVHVERGKFLGPMLAAGNVGTCIGPIFGGLIAYESGSFEWAFWALFIFGAFMLLALAFLLPETARNIVGNGSLEDKKWNQPFWKFMRRSWRGAQNLSEKSDDQPQTAAPKRSLRISNVFKFLKIVFYKDCFLSIWISSSFYALWYCVQASIPSTYSSSPYNFSELQVGLAYLTGAVGVICCMYVSGRVLDCNYAITARRIGFPVDKKKGDDLAKFPIERARSRGCAWVLLISLCSTIGYGWALETHAHVSIPLILQGVLGFVATWLIQAFSIVIVDIFPDSPGTASTANNTSRCLLSAGAVAMMQPLIDQMGRGWFFTLVGILSGAVGLAFDLSLRRWGKDWRNARESIAST